MQADISKVQWEAAISRVHTCSLNSRHTLIQFKVLNRLHYSKSKMSKIFQSHLSAIVSLCWRDFGSLFFFWSCPQIFDYWTAIFRWFSKCYVKDISLKAYSNVLEIHLSTMHTFNTGSKKLPSDITGTDLFGQDGQAS